MKVTMYITDTCPYGIQAKKYLDDKRIPYEEKNVVTDMAAREEMINKSGQLGVPVIDIDGTIIVGYNRDKIEETLLLAKNLTNSRCDNCGRIWDDSQLNSVLDLDMRINTPAQHIPTGECTSCGALCYRIGPDNLSEQPTEITVSATFVAARSIYESEKWTIYAKITDALSKLAGEMGMAVKVT